MAFQISQGNSRSSIDLKICIHIELGVYIFFSFLLFIYFDKYKNITFSMLDVKEITRGGGLEAIAISTFGVDFRTDKKSKNLSI